jgi:transposase-like protein
MKLTEALSELVGVKCDCGRERMPVHCRQCGSRTIYSKDANSAKIQLPDADGDIIAQGFRCRKCGEDFNEASPCKAPVQEIEEKVAALQEIDDPQHIEQLAEMSRLLSGADPRQKREVLHRLFADAKS